MNGSLTIRFCAVIALGVLASCSSIDNPDDTNQDPRGDDTVSVTDSLPPAPIEDAVLTVNDSTFVITLTWTAPCDDSLSEPVQAYDIRYSLSSYALSLWDLGIRVFDPPVPAVPGVMQSYSGFQYFFRGKDLYAAVRSIDEAGNVSEMSNMASVHVPGYTITVTCTDAYTGDPIEGLDGVLYTGITYHMATDTSGSFTKKDIPRGDFHIAITSGGAASSYHGFLQLISISNDTAATVPMIPFHSTAAGGYQSLLELFKLLTRTNADPGTVLRKWRRYPVPCYIPPFVNANQVDYGAAAKQAATRWMTASGWEIFSFVDAPPDTGIVVEYRTQQEMGVQRAFTVHADGVDKLPLKDTIKIADYMADADFV